MNINFFKLDRDLLMVTQMAAIAAARAAGRGDRNLADAAATNSMRVNLGKIPGAKFLIKIGEGERDEAPMLFIGEEIGNGTIVIDIAVDPLENTNATANLASNAICVLAASPNGGLITASDGYMDKLIVGPKVGGRVKITDSPEKTITIIAKSLNRHVEDLTITILDRLRNKNLIDRVRSTGARVRLIADGDLIPGILACISGASTHGLMGIGASPEGVITAAAVKLLGGEMQAKFWPRSEEDRKRLISMGIDLSRVYSHNDLAPGKDLLFCVTAVTTLSSATKPILSGVSFFGGAARTESMLITSRALEIISTTHILDRNEFDQHSEFRLF